MHQIKIGCCTGQVVKEFEDSEKGAESDLLWNESMGRKVTSKEVVDLEKIKECTVVGPW